jgi:transketolase
MMTIHAHDVLESVDVDARARAMRRHIIRMTTHAGSGHPAPSFSIVDILAVLYFSEMNIRGDALDDPERDLFALSKGHAAPALYAALREIGSITDDEMFSLRQLGSALQGHPDSRMAGVDVTSGSLGIGLSQAVGRALGARMRGSRRRVFALVGDGECQEGQIWEAALAAAQLRLGNLVLFVDANQYQVGGLVKDVIAVEPLRAKWEAFGWYAEEIPGHDTVEIHGFLKRARTQMDKPCVAIAHTRKGHGVSFLAGGNNFHAQVLSPQDAERALAELEDPHVPGA